MRRLGNLFVAFAMALAVPTILPAVAMPDTQGTTATCPGTDNERVRLWENEENDTSDDNDSLWRCASTSDLADISHTLGGDCNRPWPPSGSWNDCVSSFTLWVPDNRRFCLYRDADYGTVITTKVGPISNQRFNVGAIYNDTPSSFRFRSSATSCTAP